MHFRNLIPVLLDAMVSTICYLAERLTTGLSFCFVMVLETAALSKDVMLLALQLIVATSNAVYDRAHRAFHERTMKHKAFKTDHFATPDTTPLQV